MTRTTLPLASITISDRLRKDYGDDDMERLCNSMERLGLIQPVVVNQNLQLIAGGRRCAAAIALGWTEINVVFRETLSADELHELELEENLQRKEMTWQERVCSIAQIHWVKVQRNNLEGNSWGMRETGAMLNMALGKIQHCIDVARAINANDEPVVKCDGFSEALKLLWKRSEEAAQRELSSRSVALNNSAPPSLDAYALDEDALVGFLPKDVPLAPVIPEVALSKILYHQPNLSLSVLKSLPTGCVDHCITDPPYGIDMKNLSQEGESLIDIDSIVESHGVEENQEMFAELFPQVFRVMRDKGFFVLWCDIMQWQRLYDLAIAAGFRVQRWPIVWYKTHPCKNQAAAYNSTKDIELAMICRKPNTTIPRILNSSVISADGTKTQEKYGHPFAKPEECWTGLLWGLTMEGDTILEPFAGRGSGVIPMITMLRKVIAIEYDETHFAYLVENTKRAFLDKNADTKFI